MDYPWSFWIAFHVMVFSLLYLDLSVFHKKNKAATLSSAIGWSFFWIGLALTFNVFIYFSSGMDDALLFFTGYVIEKSLSVDNIFVFLLVFAALKIDKAHQHKILYWGILGALVFRLCLILLGVAALEKYSWLYYILGAFLCLTGIRFLFDTKEKKGIEGNPVYKLARKFLPITSDPSDGDFFIQKRGKLFVTSSFLALLLIETADVVFALDSIPAILAITTDPFIVYTSNVFAILGLRSLYFVLSHFQEKLRYFSFGLAAILFFIGLKMFLGAWLQVSVGLSLEIIGAILIITVLCSLYAPHKKS